MKEKYSNKMDELIFACNEQREELKYRRKRKRQVFVWTNSILIAILGSSLATSPERVNFSIKEGTPERVLISFLVILFVIFSVNWQWYQRYRESKHQRVISDIYGVAGFTEGESSVYPSDWDKWGSKHVSIRDLLSYPSRIMATALIGLITLMSVWIDLMF